MTQSRFESFYRHLEVPFRPSSLSTAAPHIETISPTDHATPTFKIEGVIDASFEHLIAMIREPDLSKKAGNIQHWEVQETQGAPSFCQKIFYVTHVRPIKPRALYVECKVARPNSDTLLLTYQSLPTPDALKQAHKGCVWSDVIFSGYQFVRLSANQTALRRIINVDAKLMLPRWFERQQLKKFYLENYHWMNREGRRGSERYQERMNTDPVYAWLANSAT